MGISSQQARLLTITARKSDCEFQSMRLSHQKLGISRDMTDISSEYQNSLNMTKLMYDFYGKGSENNPLSYDILMRPTALNDYTPKLITDPQGRVVLDSKYAAAARAAGIPQEGIGGLPSDNVRNQFVDGLASQNLITKELSDIIKNSKYNQLAGVGSTETIKVTTGQGNINVLKKMMEDLTGTMALNGVDNPNAVFLKNSSTSAEDVSKKNITLHNLFSGDYSILLTSDDNQKYPENQVKSIANYLSLTFIPQMADQFALLLDTGDPYVKEALAYAESQTSAMFNPDLQIADLGTSVHRGKATGVAEQENHIKKNQANNVGIVYTSWYRGAFQWSKGFNSACGVSLSNIGDTVLTYFAKYMEGVAKTGNYGVNKGDKNGFAQNIVTKDPTYLYTFNTGSTITASDAKTANFYDTIFNQLCTKGWLENGSITDNSYLQETLQSGKMFVSSLSDDGYYYQGNYATDKYIKEMADDAAIAQAEARYNTQKSKLNQKEQSLDLKMKNLDTEISSLSTEYDTVKSTISKNIEKSFKRFNA